MDPIGLDVRTARLPTEPALRNLANLAPELEQVTDRLDDVGQIVEGLPGSKLLQRRGKAKADDDG